MDARVIDLEAGLQDVRSALLRMETKLDSLATKAEVTAVVGRLDGLDARLRAVEIDGGKTSSQLGGVVTQIASLDARLGQQIASMDARLGQQVASMDTRLGQIINKLPSWWQMPAVIGVTVGLLVLLYSMAEYLHAAGRL